MDGHQADALHYMRSLGLEPITASEAVIAVRLLLQCGSWEEAFDAQRKICDNFLRLGGGWISLAAAAESDLHVFSVANDNA